MNKNEDRNEIIKDEIAENQLEDNNQQYNSFINNEETIELQKETEETFKDSNTYNVESNNKGKRNKKKGKSRFISGILAGIILGSIITLAITYALLPNMLSARGIDLTNTPQQEITINPSKDYSVYTAVAKKVMPSVVGITTVELQNDWPFGIRKVPGVGTGVIVDSRGYILTNSHVVGDGNAEEVMALLNDGRHLKAEVLWNEKSLDLAILKVESDNLKEAELGDSDETEVGEIAIAIGNPLGLTFERSLTQGVISGLNRTITVNSAGETIENLMQTDASINPGNSGGPLLNSKGEVVGINTAKITTGEGLGFAIPINIAKPIVDQFIEKGEFTKVYLGVQARDIEVYEGLTGRKASSDYGAYVGVVVENSVASKYGIKVDDIIIKIGDEKINRVSNLIRTLYKYRPGDKETVTVIRNNKEIDIDIVFDSEFY